MTGASSRSLIATDEIRAQCDRIVQSRVFSRSKRQCDFLSYIVKAAIAGDEQGLKEYALGIDVFEKDSSFDPNIDSLVRVEASRLRSKLREYYSEHGVHDPIKIEVPKGHYIPTFTRISPVPDNAEPVVRTTSIKQKSFAIIAVLLGIVAILFWLFRNEFDAAVNGDPSPIASDVVTPLADLERSIGVLPFRNRSEIDDDAYFVDGIHDDLLTQLSKLSFFSKVISRTTMEQYRDSELALSDVAAELGVAILLEGAVQRAGDRVRINAQLIDAAADRHIWSETYDRELNASTIFAIQSEISLAIAEALQSTLSATDRATLENVPTARLRAYEFYQRAQQIRRTLGLGNQPEVAELLEQAIVEDPEFALAHISLARAYMDRYFAFDKNPVHRDRARLAIDKAYALSPGMPEVHVALADYYYKGLLDYGRALEQLDMAIPLAPGSAEAYALRAFIIRRSGAIEDSLPDLVRSIELDPGNFSPHYVLANTYVMLGRSQDAIPHYDRAIDLAPGNFGLKIQRAYALTNLDRESTAFSDLIDEPAFLDGSANVEILYRWEVALMERDYDTAVSILDGYDSDIIERQSAYYPLSLMRALTEVVLGEPQNADASFVAARAVLADALVERPEDPRILSAIGFAYAGLGDSDAAILAANQAYDLHSRSVDAVDGPMYVLNFAITYALLGENQLAVEMLDELLSLPSPWYATLSVVERLPHFDALRTSSEYAALISKYASR